MIPDPESVVLEALEVALEWGDVALTERLRAVLAGTYMSRFERFYHPPICGVISLSGRLGEPLACGYLRDHDGPHAWASLPTWDAPAETQATA